MKYYKEHYGVGQIATMTLEEQKNLIGYNIKELTAETLQKLWDKKLNCENVTYLDVLIYINKNNLPIYELTRKRINKIN